MKSFASPSKPANARESLHQHLHMYALAASAGGVSVLALVQPGEAEVIYTPVQVTIAPNSRYNLDLNNDGIVDFTLKNRTWNTTSGWYWNFFVQHPGGNAVAGHIAAYGFPWAYALRSGMRIDKVDRHFAAGRASMVYYIYNWDGRFSRGSWNNVNDRYLGLKFKIDGQVHYGWARLTTQQSTVTLTGYAYETIPNKPIKAGAEQGNVDDNNKMDSLAQPDPATRIEPAQKPATLGMLARGAKGLRAWRQNEEPSVTCDKK
jgi:hypothetical protein